VNDDQVTALREAVDKNFESQVAFTTELVRFSSLRRQESAAQDFVAEGYALTNADEQLDVLRECHQQVHGKTLAGRYGAGTT
jgi:aminoglycoside phosphotransferase family enzyme